MMESRMGEIALEIIFEQICETGLPSPNTFPRELGNMVTKLEGRVSKGELIDFFEAIYPRYYGRIFHRNNVSIITSPNEE